MKPFQTGDLVGDYRVIEIAGSGGMGAVYKIEHVITRRIEAMKILPRGLSCDPELERRFEREIQVQARLHHPNIVALYNAVRDGESVALVMEFVEGESLQSKMAAGALPLATALDIAGQVLRALAYAHKAGVIHRDVAPANIIITPEGVAKLTDFGLALGTTDLRLSSSGAPVGSPWYMSPEQVKGTGTFDARTDLYAMGAVLHEMLAGAKLFEGEGAFAVMRAHVEAEPALPSSRNPAIPSALDEIVRKAVAKDPALRFQSADEFRFALQKAVYVLPVLAPFLRVRRAAAGMALVAAGMVAGFCAVRFVPATRRAQAAIVKPLPAGTAPRDAPVAPLVPVSPPLSTPPAEPIDEVKAAVPVRHRAPAPVAMQRSVNPSPRSNAIRVTGGELVPPTTVASSPATVPAVEVEAMPSPPLAEVSAPQVPAVTPAVVPPKAPNSGNRLLRALGKVNPFRKTKHDAADAAKTPLTKD